MDLLLFVAERYNYWIFITLMMIGLYIVIARGNLIKKLIGLNLFQTSVFIYYISIGKITGGTAPIYVAGDMDARAHADGDGGGHGADPLPGKDALGVGSIHADENIQDGFELSGNDLSTLIGRDMEASQGAAIHSAPPGGANDFSAAPVFELANPAQHNSDAAHAIAEVVYSNPLPHVLILTAIVVGIATTAVGLALVVRIREAYGTIEEDELEAADQIAEFGALPVRGGVAA